MTDDREMWYRVPRSAEECAVHLEAGGVVEFNWADGWAPCHTTAALFSVGNCAALKEYRLVYSTPVGMSPVIGAPGHAYGLAKDAPEEWLARGCTDGTDAPPNCFHANSIIEARPPAPAPEPRTEKVPLTKLVGRTIPGHNAAVQTIFYRRNPDGWIWQASESHGGSHLTVDVETGMVEVLAEEEA